MLHDVERVRKRKRLDTGTDVDEDPVLCFCPYCLSKYPRHQPRLVSRSSWYRHKSYCIDTFRDAVMYSEEIKSRFIEPEPDLVIQLAIPQNTERQSNASLTEPDRLFGELERVLQGFGTGESDATRNDGAELSGIRSFYQVRSAYRGNLDDPGVEDIQINMCSPGIDDSVESDQAQTDEPETEIFMGQETGTGSAGANNTLQGTLEMEALLDSTKLGDLKESLLFVKSLREATLDSTGLEMEDLHRLRNPLTSPPSISNPDVKLSLDIFISLDQSSQETYRKVREAIIARFPTCKPLTFEKVRKKAKELSGVCTISEDMCTKSCVAFTGPYAEMTQCPICDEPRYDQAILAKSRGSKRVPRRKFQTIPLGFQLQAGWRHPTGAFNMRYRERKTAGILARGANYDEIDDYIQGTDYLELVRNGNIRGDDIALMFSTDGAQLYQSKASDCWIYIWVVMNYAPDLRYKKSYVLPGAFIPGPNKPKHLESFLLPGLQHFAALQKEGLKIWDSNQSRFIISYPFLLMATADSPAMAQLSGLVGHHGKAGCRLYCGLNGRHKPGGSQYYPVLSKPIDSDFTGSNGDTILVTNVKQPNSGLYEQNLLELLSSSSSAQYRSNRLKTGIARPSIFLGLLPGKTLSIPKLFPLDVMHLISLNLPDLLISLWCGKLEIDSQDSILHWIWVTLKGRNWELHGKMVAETKQYLPSSFDRPPRNPAEKINSGYKAYEFLNYVFGVGPGVFIYFIPQVFYQNYCKLVHAARLLQQQKISRKQIHHAHRLLLEFVREFEDIYYRQLTSRIHFVRQSVHLLLHLAHETLRIGPLITYSQWPMERTIGNLGQEIKQHSNPYANLSERGARRCRVNAIAWMFPELGLNKIAPSVSRTSKDLGNGYILLQTRDKEPNYKMSKEETLAFVSFLSALNAGLQGDGIDERMINNICQYGCFISRWARLQLPTGQIARSVWKEGSLKSVRSSRNVKFQVTPISQSNRPKYAIGEVHYYFQIRLNGVLLALAMISKYGAPNPALLRLSSGSLYSSKYYGTEGLQVIGLHSITSVVGMVKHTCGFDSIPLPDPAASYEAQYQFTKEELTDTYFLVEKIGLDTLQMAECEGQDS